MPRTCLSAAVAWSKDNRRQTALLNPPPAIRPTKLGGLARYIAVLTEWVGLSPVESLLRRLANGVHLIGAESER